MIPPRLSFQSDKAATRSSSKNVALHSLDLLQGKGQPQVKATFQAQEPRTPSAMLKKEDDGKGDFSSSVYQLGFSHFKEKYQKLDQQMYQQKNLINMIIHDLRCPTAQIQHTAGNQLASLESLRLLIDELHECNSQDQELVRCLEDLLEGHPKSDIISKDPELQQLQSVSSSRCHRLSALQAALVASADVFSESPGDKQLCMSLLQRVDLLLKRSSSGTGGSPTPPEPKVKRRVSQNQSSFFKLGNKALELSSNTSSSFSGQDLDIASEKPWRSNRLEANDYLESDDEANASFCSEKSQSRTLYDNLCDMGIQQPKLIDEVSTSHLRHLTGNLSFFNQSLDGFLDQRPRSAFCSFRKLDHELKLSRPCPELTGIVNKIRASIDNKSAALQGISSEIKSLSKMTASCEYSSAILLSLINDLMDLAKAENNAFSINNNFFDLEKSLQEAVATLEFMSEQKQISTSLKVRQYDANRLRSVFGDSGRLKQVLVNLMSNALKFTDEGGKVEVSLSLIQSSLLDPSSIEMPHLEDDLHNLNGQSSIMHCISIEVKDNGDGISKEGQSKLFKNYASLAEHREKNERGTGLGLCICKQIIERMGGTISVESTLGEGTTFTISMSLLSDEHLKKPLHEYTPKSMMKKIKPLDREVITEIEQSSLSSSDSSYSSDKQITWKTPLASKVQSPLRFSEVAPARSTSRDLRIPKSSKPTHNMSFNWRDCALNGQLGDQKRKLNRQHTFNSRTKNRDLEIFPSDQEPNPWTNLNVLIVNDEPVSLMILKQLVKDQLRIPKVQTAHNGKVAVTKAMEGFFDVIILDLHMPVLDGFEAARQIKSSNLCVETILVALSASSFSEDLVQQCRDAGFQKWLTAPVSKQQLQQEVFEEFFPSRPE